MMCDEYFAQDSELSTMDARYKRVVELEHSTDWLLGRLRQLRVENKYCDVRIRVESETYNCHKVILCAASRYFDVMFASGMSESTAEEVTLPDLRCENFKDALTFIYGEKDVVTSDNAEMLLHIASRLQIEQLIEKCEAVMLNELEADNAIGLWKTAAIFNCGRLQDESFKLIVQSFDEIVQCEDFLSLDKDELIKIIEYDSLNTRAEERVCRAVIRWIKADHGRKDDIVRLLPHLRLYQVDVEYILESIFTIPELHRSKESMQYLQEVMQYHCVPENRHTKRHVDIRARNFWNKISLVVIFGRRLSEDGSVDQPELLGYNPKDNKWHSLIQLPRDFGDDFAVCPFGNDLWVSGGTKRPKQLSRLSADLCRFIDKPEMDVGRIRHCMVATRDKVYCIGGYDDGVQGSIYSFDVSLQKWDKCGDLRHPVDGASAAVLQKKIFIFGGSEGLFQDNKTIQCFDPETGYCSLVGNLPSIQKMTRAITYMNSIFLVCSDGGVYKFGADNSLRKMEHIPTFNRTYFGVYKTDDSMCIMGGFDLNKEVDLMYDSLTNAVVKLGDGHVPIPNVLPYPFEVFTCFYGNFEPKYPYSNIQRESVFSTRPR